jgi:hypothetical protein
MSPKKIIEGIQVRWTLCQGTGHHILYPLCGQFQGVTEMGSGTDEIMSSNSGKMSYQNEGKQRYWDYEGMHMGLWNSFQQYQHRC